MAPPASRSSKPSRKSGNAKISSVRIIGGLWKRTPLPVVNVPGLRPTPDRVRETVFNWLTHQFDGSLAGLSVLDLFAGSGAMGFEAASRGASRVVLSEQDANLIENLHMAKEKLKASMMEIQHASAMTLVQSYKQMAARAPEHAQRFDVIFLDPPYRQGWLDQLLPQLSELLTPRGLIYAEAEVALDPAAMTGFGLEILRADKAGQVFYHLLRQINE